MIGRCTVCAALLAASAAPGEDRHVDFAINVSRHVLLHEMAHALIREFDLPVLGNEETMADAYATITVAGIMRDDATEIIGDRAKSWFYEAEESPPVLQDLKGEHEIDARRAYRSICLLYGADPAHWGDVVDWIDLSDRDADDCSDTAPDIMENWARILAPYRTGQDKNMVIVRHGEAEHTGLVHDAKLLEEIAEIMRQYDWPHPVILHYDSCGQERAYWSRQERRILICDEYFARFMRQAESLVN